MSRITRTAVLGAAAMFTAAANADVLLLIDLSVTNQVTISATGGLSATTLSGPDATGVYLENFYNGTGASVGDTLVSGNLSNAQNLTDNSPDLFRGGGGTDPGLNIWSWSNDTTVSFTAGSVAFTGSGTWNLTAGAYADMLNANPTGDLYFPADTFDDVAAASFLGTYSIIPTPGAMSLCGLCLAAGLRRNRR